MASTSNTTTVCRGGLLAKTLQHAQPPSPSRPRAPDLVGSMEVEPTHRVLVVGGGPAGLMAAELLSAAGVAVDLFDAMPSVGRKFLLAGRGGLNLSHSELLARFLSRFGPHCNDVSSALHAFNAEQLQAWARSLGVSTFVGSSGRIFPNEMKASPLLRAWLQRLRQPEQGQPVKFHLRHRWVGWADQGGKTGLELRFLTPQGPSLASGDAVLLALGGASWARLGSDGLWVDQVEARGIAVSPLRPSNCGFDVAPAWSPYFGQRFAGQALKTVALTVTDVQGQIQRQQGEFVVTRSGFEGSLVYAFSRQLRDQIDATGQANFVLDLLPDLSLQRVQAEINHPRGSRSLANHLKSRLSLAGVKLALLHECLGPQRMHQAGELASAIKALPMSFDATRPLDEAISTAGGVRFEGLDSGLMAKACPGLFCAGEMLDWEAPTGGYLLTASLATGRQAADGVLDFLEQKKTGRSSAVGQQAAAIAATRLGDEKGVDEP